MKSELNLNNVVIIDDFLEEDKFYEIDFSLNKYIEPEHKNKNY